MTATITEIHTVSRGTYDAPGVHAEPRSGLGIWTDRKRRPNHTLRRIMGWSIAGCLRGELAYDAHDTARWRRRPPTWQTVAYPNHRGQYTSRGFGQRIRTAALLGSMGTIGVCFDNSVVEIFFGTM